tara:strand:+ start:33 stop:371 length:339 start_codon:yes stop_codon:yes gene_type:complete
MVTNQVREGEIKMNWKKILKEQRTLMNWNTSPSNKPPTVMIAEQKQEMQQMETVLNQNKGRIKYRVSLEDGGNKVVDLATYRLGQLKYIKSMTYPENVEEFNKFKQEYSVNF